MEYRRETPNEPVSNAHQKPVITIGDKIVTAAKVAAIVSADPVFGAAAIASGTVSSDETAKSKDSVIRFIVWLLNITIRISLWILAIATLAVLVFAMSYK